MRTEPELQLKESGENMNTVALIGRLTKDPEVKYTAGENPTAVARFSIAVNDGDGENERTSFINIVAFGKQAENCERFLSKGRQVGITGRIQTGSYEKDGRTVYTTDVIASRVEFLGGRAAEVDDGEPSKNIESPEQMGGFVAVEGDIPF